jgi:lipoprotein-anchoring transpeptidase ErfK/SrfK
VAQKKKSSSKQHSHFGDFLAVLLLTAMIVGVGWFWWQQKHPHKHSSKKAAHKIVLPETAPVKIRPTDSISTIPVPAPVPIPSPAIVSNPEPIVISPPPVVLTKTNIVVITTPLTTNGFPRPVRDTLEMQVALARRAISPGAIDGANGSQTHAALVTFQHLENLSASGVLDTNTRAQLTLDAPVLTNYTVTADDLAGLQPIGKTWLEKSQQSSLAFETELELIGEKAHANPALIKKLNPGVDWTKVIAGTTVQLPDVNYPDPDDKAAFVVIHLSQRYLEAFDAQTNLLAHFPCSIAAKVEKRPVGELQVVVVIPDPNYTVNPELFPESDELQKLGHKIVLPPGPNNPVGIAWIGLNRPGYGMHGTPVPEQVGRTESHGCFRLANWDAAYLLKLAWVGMPVNVEP